MLLKSNETIFVAHRRLFEKDNVRFFVGRVDAYDAGIVRATGHSYVRDNMSGAMLEKAESRTKLFSVASGTLIFHTEKQEPDLLWYSLPCPFEDH